MLDHVALKDTSKTCMRNSLNKSIRQRPSEKHFCLWFCRIDSCIIFI